jgi:pimeloyl-ACP methyl ester carboxylesterase
MTTLTRRTLVFILFLWTSQVIGQQKIPYGSNNGKYISIFNTPIYYEEYGKGTPLILLQGGMGGIEDFALCIPDLSKHFRVIAPDTPGQGRSELADSMSYELMAEYISKFIDALKLDSAYVIGWSDGGNTGLILGSNRPDKIKKVLASGANYKLSGYPSILNDTTDWEKELRSREF